MPEPTENRQARPASRFDPRGWLNRSPVVPVVRLSGAIGAVTPLRPGLTLAALAGPLQRAFSVKNARAVAISINSPGGSAVQSRLIYQRIRALADEKELPVYVFCEDVAASGGYMLALAGEEIYADPGSIIGSIGVVSAGFGFDRLIEKMGVERRVYTAGKNKMILDPFLPEKAEDVKRIKGLQNEVHKVFIDMVRQARGDKLKGTDAKLFNGDFWSGQTALELGLIDGLGELRTVMREKFGEDVKLKLVSADKGWLRRRLSGIRRARTPEAPIAMPSSWAEELISAAEARSLWARFGL
jgi:signal peptide peptidase SppA